MAESTAASGFPSDRAIDGERRARDPADPRGEPVHPVDEVDHVHQRDDPEHAHRHRQPLREGLDADEREREPLERQPERHRNGGGRKLAAELAEPGQVVDVVEQPDDGRDRGADQDSAVDAVERQKRDRPARRRR